jgi:hypothetical protein
MKDKPFEQPYYTANLNIPCSVEVRQNIDMSITVSFKINLLTQQEAYEELKKIESRVGLKAFKDGFNLIHTSYLGVEEND